MYYFCNLYFKSLYYVFTTGFYRSFTANYGLL